MMQIEDRVFVVTGASSGIGLATAIALSCQQRLDQNWDRLGFLATVRVPCCYRDRQPSRERPLHCLDRTTQPGAADPRTG